MLRIVKVISRGCSIERSYGSIAHNIFAQWMERTCVIGIHQFGRNDSYSGTFVCSIGNCRGDAGSSVAVPLPNSTHYRIQALTRAERDDYLRERLEDKAIGFSAQLAGDKVLDSLTRTPLILAEVVSLYGAGESIPASKLGVLESVARLMERSEDHQAALVDVPLALSEFPFASITKLDPSS